MDIYNLAKEDRQDRKNRKDPKDQKARAERRLQRPNKTRGVGNFKWNASVANQAGYYSKQAGYFLGDWSDQYDDGVDLAEVSHRFG
jgi:hypothetical protein